MLKALLLFGLGAVLSDCSVIPTTNKVCSKSCLLKKGYRCLNGECVPDKRSHLKTCGPVLCNAGFICKNGKCAKDPNYCKKDSDCSDPKSCVNNQCFDKCSVVKCKAGYQCDHGNCVDMCSKMECPKGQSCLEGTCTPAVQVCPADSSYEVTQCISPRPNQSQCPVLNYIRAPDPLFCGVKADGSLVDFARDCEACKDKSISYYFNTPCQLAPVVCKSGQYCEGTSCVPSKK